MVADVHTDGLTQSNLFLRRLWARLRQDFGDATWNHIPVRNGPAREITFGQLHLHSARETTWVHVNYDRRDSIRCIRFDGVDEGTELADRLRAAVAVARDGNVPARRFQCTIPLTSLGLTFHPVKAQRFSLQPIDEAVSLLVIEIDGFDAVDAEAQSAAAMNVALNVLTAATRYPLWEHRTHQPMSPDSSFDDTAILELNGRPDQSTVLDGRMALFQEAVELVDWGLDFPVRESIERLLRACDLFRVARLYDAQVEDVVTTGEFIPAGDGVYQAQLGTRESLYRASRFGRRQAEIATTLYMSVLEVVSDTADADRRTCTECGQKVYSISRRVRDR